MQPVFFNASIDIDVSGLREAIPRIVNFGRRTLEQQVVTSAAFVCIDAQNHTPAVEISRIDSELEVTVTGYTAKGRVSKAKNPFERRVSLQNSGKAAPLAVLIVMARTDPTSWYSSSTGNRWPLDRNSLPKGPGSNLARQMKILEWIRKMTLARHSSTHFLQHGWAPAIKRLLRHPAYYAGRSKFRLTEQTRINPLNTLGGDDLGMAMVTTVGDASSVTAENAVGTSANQTLGLKHREALIREGLAPLQTAIDRETIKVLNKVQEYIDRGMQAEIGPT